MTPETEERIVSLEWLRANALYYVLNREDWTAFAVCWSKCEGMERGYTMKYTNLGWWYTPTASHMDSRLKVKKDDLTVLLDIAVWHCLPIEERIIKTLRGDEWTSWDTIKFNLENKEGDIEFALDFLIETGRVVDNPNRDLHYMLI